MIRSRRWVELGIKWCVLIACGATGCIVVCWSTALVGKPGAFEFVGQQTKPWVWRVPTDWPNSAAATWQYRTAAKSGYMQSAWAPDGASHPSQAERRWDVDLVKYGWPLRALAAGSLTTTDSSGAGRIVREFGKRLPASMAPDSDGSRRLGTAILLPGFIGNALLYATVLWGAARLGKSVLLYYFRRRSNFRCSRCGYELKALPTQTCPECGQRTVVQQEQRTA